MNQEHVTSIAYKRKRRFALDRVNINNLSSVHKGLLSSPQSGLVCLTSLLSWNTPCLSICLNALPWVSPWPTSPHAVAGQTVCPDPHLPISKPPAGLCTAPCSISSWHLPFCENIWFTYLHMVYLFLQVVTCKPSESEDTSCLMLILTP